MYTYLHIIQLHNIAWSCEFKKDVHPTPESSQEPTTDPQVQASIQSPPAGQSWTPEKILEDVDEVLDYVEQINECLGGQVAKEYTWLSVAWVAI